MIRKTFACLFLASLIGAAVSAQTADELIDKGIQARGGRDKIKSIQSIRMTGKMIINQGGQMLEMPIVMEAARPDKVRIDSTFQGMTMVQAFDGTTGWTVMPFMGKKDPEAVSGEQLDQIKRQADVIDGLLVDYKEKGHQVEYAGKEDLEGTPAHKLKVTRKDGDIVYVYLDAEQFLELKHKQKTKLPGGQEIESEAAMSDYKEVGGILFPHSMEMKAGPGTMSMTLDKIELNPDLPASRFEMPKAEKKPAQ